MFREIIGNETSTKNAQFLSLLHRNNWNKSEIGNLLCYRIDIGY